MIADPSSRRAPEGSEWRITLDLLEAALAGGDAEAVAAIPVPGAHLVVPVELVDRLRGVAGAIAALEGQVERRLRDVGRDLESAAPREWHSAPPAPSQLDCSA